MQYRHGLLLLPLEPCRADFNVCVLICCLQVSSNGLFSFGRSVNFFSPVLFPNSTTYRYMVAPFWADHDPRPSGQISYEVHNRNTELLSSVNRFIRQQTATDFNGNWLLVGEWNNVAEYGSTADKVSAVARVKIVEVIFNLTIL